MFFCLTDKPERYCIYGNAMRCKITVAAIVLIVAFASTAMPNEETNNRKEKENSVSQETEKDFNNKYAAGLNNLVWSLLEKEDRTEGENASMISSAHASLYHWSRIGTDINLQRGQWLISHVYAVLNMPESALYHADRCLKITVQNNLKDFDLAYAYEAMARAYAVSKNRNEALKYMGLAEQAGNSIEKQEDKDLFFSDFNAEPWYGIKK